MTSQREHCPICDNRATITQISDQNRYDCAKISCPRCGNYALSNIDEIGKLLKELSADQIIHYSLTAGSSTSNEMHSFLRAASTVAYSSKLKTDMCEARAIISHALSAGPVHRILMYSDLTEILANTALPLPAEQADRLIQYIGDKLSGVGDMLSVADIITNIKYIGARIGSRIGSELNDFGTLV